MNTQLLALMLIPSVAVIAAGIIGALASLPTVWRSAVQHFAAGIVFAAIATEIVPGVMHAGIPGAALAGFAAGVAAMFAMRSLAARLERGSEGKAFPLGFVAAVSIDCVIDGIVIGTGFAAGAREGVLIVAALALEMFFLGLTAADTIRATGARITRVVAVCVGLALVLGASALIGYSLLVGAPAAIVTTLLAFGCAALLYLVTEELLVRAHEHGETTLVTSLFFLGFMAILAAELLS
ncbi:MULTISPECIES: ZIP family metal transporter [Sphingomonas]|jgi:zinc transporter, ZIP family|uniref:ZIP family zinc transporter n=1 Tax=Sphingomonas aquatilis TaxID=93063 RepID=A0AAW3TVN2_9SPHN|nr:membrane protein [Sphingomonas aquatilis]MBB3877268.1 ZIP family zinc transporter [Sphingomonas aquatilis]GEM71461.1 membrane protein [Sphingomonas aquatilis NBRC 16722]